MYERVMVANFTGEAVAEIPPHVYSIGEKLPKRESAWFETSC